jgi:hypothetical protein
MLPNEVQAENKFGHGHTNVESRFGSSKTSVVVGRKRAKTWNVGERERGTGAQ